MTEQRVKRITLFIMETLILQQSNKINELFAYLFNKFIVKCYHENNELLVALYDDIELLGKFIEEEYQILTYDQMCQLLTKCNGFNGYVSLIDEVGYETDKKLNVLAAEFANYQKDYWSQIEQLYNADPYEFYPKGFPRILQ